MYCAGQEPHDACALSANCVCVYKPRVCFLSVCRCFEAVRELVFEADGEISGMVSVEGEKIPFIDRVNPAASGG